MNYKIIFLLFFALGNLALIQAQGIWAAQLEKRVYAQDVSAKIEIFRKGYGGMSEKIRFDWGDGVVEEIGPPGAFQYIPQYDLTRATYFSKHYYDEEGLYELSFVDSFLVPGVKNISDSGQRYLRFKDTLNILSEDHPFSYNYAPLFIGYPDMDSYYTGENGKVLYPAQYSSNDVFISAEDFRETVVPFPTDGVLPTPGDVYMDDNVLVWDRPIEAGVYGFCIKVREFRKGFSNPEDSIFMSTAHRVLMIEVDSNMLVSSLNLSPLKGMMSFFPNPAYSTLNIQTQYTQSTKGKLLIENLAGQTIHSEDLNLSPVLQSWQVNVSNWSSGVYVVRLQAGAEQVVQRFVVQRQ